jgi:16S rRNA (guanine1516-N2)-methyltransferase
MSRLWLRKSADGYALIDRESRQRPLVIDFASNELRHRVRAGGTELLARAVGAKPGLSVFDCTAGLGVDAFILASRGCRVTMVERSTTLFLMLEDALARARGVPEVSNIVERIALIRGDARSCLAGLDIVPDAITIDPMFPERRKSAQVRGELQLLQRLLGKDEEVRSLVAAARATGCRRIVVKRPVSGGSLPGLDPSHVVKAKASRFDVFT